MIDAYSLSNHGSRGKMEDYVELIKNFNNNSDWIFGGVFDGHGGDSISKLACEKLSGLLLNNIKQNVPIIEAFRKSYEQLSELAQDEFVGSTALSFLLQENKLFVANIGDCRMIGISNGKIEQLTDDHTVNNVAELERISKFGAKIYSRYIIKGLNGVSVTRAFGDLHFKDAGVISEPEIFEVILPENGVVIAGSDGIWSIFSNEEVANFAYHGTAQEIAENILAEILQSSKEPFDNISMIVLRIMK